MICKNCGTSNSNNRTFCSYCGNNIDESRNEKNSSPILKIAIVMLSLVLLAGGGYLLLRGKLLNNDISINEIIIDGDYKMNNDTYVFDLNKVVILNPKVESSKDVDLEYEIEDSSVATLVKLDNKCSIVGIKPQETNLNIYNGDEILKVVKISFVENNNGNDISSDTNSELSTNINNQDNTATNKPGANTQTEERIPVEEIELLMNSFYNNYEDAINYGMVSNVSGDLVQNGELYNEFNRTIPNTYEKGIKIQLEDYNKINIQRISNEQYRVTYVAKWTIYNPNNDETRLQSEQADYIVKKSGSSYKIDKMQNLKIQK